MKKKLLAGILALALCSTNMLPQTIFAEEFTSGNPEEVSEETSEIFTDNDQGVSRRNRRGTICIYFGECT
ncbi:hypothetical protein M5E86_12375 [Blautia wexlerae]|nr:hypothetical protein M5E86_12375 [Blautia wexlerae]